MSSVRYRFLRNPLTEFDETLHELYTLPKNDKRNKKFRFRNFFFFSYFFPKKEIFEFFFQFHENREGERSERGARIGRRRRP